jgi:hypothetical protein
MIWISISWVVAVLVMVAYRQAQRARRSLGNLRRALSRLANLDAALTGAEA